MSNPRFPRKAGHFAQYLAVRLVLGVLRLLPVDTASALGGRLGRLIGPRLRRHEIARTNMRRALPEQSDEEIETALSQMWDNLGRTFAEYAHLDAFRRSLDAGDGRIEVRGREHLDAAAAAGRGLVAFGAHLANWELLGLLQAKSGIESVVGDRPQNNPWINRHLETARPAVAGRLAPKGAAGARDLVAVLRAGGAIGVLVDQKYNEGVAVPFFGRDAMTVSGPAELALRRGAPMIPIRIERRGGARFRITVSPPLPMPAPDSGAAGLGILLGNMNTTLEIWIRALPGQWYWVHQRWPRNE